MREMTDEMVEAYAKGAGEECKFVCDRLGPGCKGPCRLQIQRGLRAALAAMPEEDAAWREDEPPEDGTHIIAANIGTMRWGAYKPTSEQFRRGIKGRWQRAGLHGGWDNADKPTTWRPA